MTNAVPLLQLAAQHAGYNPSTGEIAAFCALSGAAVHVVHQAIAAYGRAGGWRGIRNFLDTGKVEPYDGPDTHPVTGKPISPIPKQ